MLMACVNTAHVQRCSCCVGVLCDLVASYGFTAKAVDWSLIRVVAFFEMRSRVDATLDPAPFTPAHSISPDYNPVAQKHFFVTGGRVVAFLQV